jgi:anti-anti-sigma factor
MIECRIDKESGTMFCSFPERKMDTIASAEADKVFMRSFGEASAGPGRSLKIVFDLGGVEYVASAFLRLCLSAAKSVESGNFSIINTGPQIMKVYKIAGLDSVLKVS